MMVHNEIGVIQPIQEIGKLCRSKGVFFHVRIIIMLTQLDGCRTSRWKNTHFGQ